MEDDLKKKEKKEDDLKKLWKTNQATKINLIGCDTIVNSPSFFFLPTDISSCVKNFHHVAGVYAIRQVCTLL